MSCLSTIAPVMLTPITMPTTYMSRRNVHANILANHDHAFKTSNQSSPCCFHFFNFLFILIGVLLPNGRIYTVSP